jgi:hypothetical protein
MGRINLDPCNLAGKIDKAFTGTDHQAEKKAREERDKAIRDAEEQKIAAQAAELRQREAEKAAAGTKLKCEEAKEELKREQENLDNIVKEGKSEEAQKVVRDKVEALKKHLEEVKIESELDDIELVTAKTAADSARADAENAQRLADEAQERVASMSSSGGLFGMIERDWKKTANNSSNLIKDTLNFVRKAVDTIIEIGVKIVLNSPVMLLLKLVAPDAAEKLGKDIESVANKIGEAIKSAATAAADLAIAAVQLDKKAFANSVGRIVNCINRGLKEILKVACKVIDKLLQAGVFLLQHLPIKYLIQVISPGAARAYDKAVQSAADAIGTAVKAELTLVVDLIEAAANAAAALASGDLKAVGKALSAGIDKAIKNAIVASKQMLKSLCEATHSLIKMGVSLVVMALKVVVPGVLAENLEKMLNGAANAVESLIEETLAAAVQAMDALGETLIALTRGDFKAAGKALLVAAMNAMTAGANAIGGLMVLAETVIVGALSQILPGQAAMALGIIATLNPRGIVKNVTKVAKEVATGSGLKKLSHAASEVTKKTTGELVHDVAKGAGKVLDKSAEGFMIANQFIPKGELSPMEVFALEVGLMVLVTEAPALQAAVTKKRKASAKQQQNTQDSKHAEKKAKKEADERAPKYDTDTKMMVLSSGLAAVSTLISVKEVADADALAKENERNNLILSIIGQKAAMSAAILKLNNDLNDATVSFVKNIGSSIKAAAA